MCRDSVSVWAENTEDVNGHNLTTASRQSTQLQSERNMLFK